MEWEVIRGIGMTKQAMQTRNANLGHLEHWLHIILPLPLKMFPCNFLYVSNTLPQAWTHEILDLLLTLLEPSLASTSRPCRLDPQLTWYPKPLSCSHQPGITMLESHIHSQVLHANNHQSSLVSQLHLLRKTLPRTLVHFHKNSKVKAAHVIGWGVRIVIWSGK